MNNRIYFAWLKTVESIHTFNVNDFLFKIVVLARFRKVSYHVRKVRKLIRVKHYHEAIQYGEDYINRSSFYPPLNLMKYTAHAYKHIGEQAQANELSVRVLKTFSGMSLDELMELCQKTNQFDSSIQTHYQFQGGAENLGVCIHTNDEALYFTKVMPYFKFHSNREIEFYERLERDFNQLIEFVPKYKSSVLDSNYPIQLLTTYFIDRKEIDLNHLEDLIQYDQISRQISYQSIKLDQTSYQAMNRLLHDSMIIQSMIYFISHKLKDPLLEQMESQVFHVIKKLSQSIILEKDYCLTHNDMHHKNVFWDNKKDKIVILDWNTYGWGLKGIDIMKFVSHFSFDFNWLKLNYLDKVQDDRKHIVNKMLVFVLIYYKVNQHKTIQNEMETFYQPAYQYILEESGI